MEDNIPNYYAVIPAPVLYDDSLVADAKILYAEITGLSHVKGYCWATDSHLAKLHKVGVRTIQRWLKTLEARNHIRREIVYGDPQRPKYITERRIYITAPDVQTYRHSCLYPIDTNVQQPIDTGVLDNIIEDNTISNSGIYSQTIPNESEELNPSSSLIKNNKDIDKGARKPPRNVFIVPTIEEVREFVSKENLVFVDVDYFYKHYELSDWKDKGGNLINWKQTLLKWNKVDEDKKPKNKVNRIEKEL